MDKPLKTDIDQSIRWILPKPINEDKIVNCSINYILQKVLYRRGLDLEEELDEYISPAELPNPEEHFCDLKIATERIINACNNKDLVAICGDYDADGITSTILLVELLSKLGAKAIPFIPSRKDDGYGLNVKMINNINSSGIKLVITVDNGVSAVDAINKANEYGIDLIITDHHKIPTLPLDIFSLIHPESTPLRSPYKYLAGVGIAYLLAKNICSKLSYDIDNTTAKVLYCIGTVADMAPLIGANRKWLKEYLPLINKTDNIGIRSIIKKLSLDGVHITSEHIGFKIAPLINAVGRIGDPRLIIDLFTLKNEKTIKELTKQCFELNKERKRITEVAVMEAVDIAHNEYASCNKFLVLTKREWNPGIIGIVAARILDIFNLPTAIISLGNDGVYRGSIRSNNLLKVNLALDKCKDILIAHGGHSAAAGFTIKEENIPSLKERLNKIALNELKDSDLIKSIKPDAMINFFEINDEFYRQLMLLGPFGIKNPAPIFWTRKCRILEIYKLKGGHLKMLLNDGTGSIQAIKWNESISLKINEFLDIAFYIEINRWKNESQLQLNLIDINKHKDIVDIKLHNQVYKCQLTKNEIIMITNKKGECITSNLSIHSNNIDKKQELFAEKIISFAEIALGKTA